MVGEKVEEVRGRKVDQMMFCAEPDCPGGHPCNCISGAYAAKNLAKFKRRNATDGMLPETYEIVGGDCPTLHCKLCGHVTDNGFDLELRRCHGCGKFHVPHLKPIWAKDDIELDVVEAAMELQEAETGGRYGPLVSEITKAKDRLGETCATLAAENDGKWIRP